MVEGPVPEEMPEKLKDYYRDPTYERRIVVFYDVLGWRSKITSAGRDSKKIGDLRRLILHQGRLLRISNFKDVRVTSFSDNIVLSKPVDDEADVFIQQLGPLILGATLSGFLIRGGITLGDIVHDEEVVFGPGLNRAYELESQVADVPRVVVDNIVMQELGQFSGIVVREDDLFFIDPFQLGYIKYISNAPRRARADLIQFGVPAGKQALRDTPSDRLLAAVLNGLKAEVRAPLADKEWRKVAWLYDRIARQLGVPLANSYPRIRPGEAVE